MDRFAIAFGSALALVTFSAAVLGLSDESDRKEKSRCYGSI